MKLSLCMIVKNEAKVLERCLSSTRDLFDEIIIVDTGSLDDTKAIALRYHAKVYDFVWIDDFAAARNESFAKATGDFIMWLDADDVIQEKDYLQIKVLKEQLNDNIDMVMMKYHVAFDEQDMPTMSYYRERIIQNHKGYEWVGRIHEIIIPSGNIIYHDAAICHKKIEVQDPNRNLRIFESMIQNNEPLDERNLFYYARELYYHKHYEMCIGVLNAFLKKENAWLENKLEAVLYLSYCYEVKQHYEKALTSLFQSFVWTLPRASILCEIASNFMYLNQYEQAIYYYRQALTCTPVLENGGFENRDCYGFIPCIQLCVCYEYLRDRKLAIYYNEKAALYKPEHAAVLNNREYFRSHEK